MSHKIKKKHSATLSQNVVVTPSVTSKKNLDSNIKNQITKLQKQILQEPQLMFKGLGKHRRKIWIVKSTRE